MPAITGARKSKDDRSCHCQLGRPGRDWNAATERLDQGIVREEWGPDYRKNVFTYIDQEDSPRPVTYQLELLRKVGFTEVDLLHQNITFAAFGARKGDE